MAAFWMITIGVTASLAFVSFMVWLENRRQEREAHYRNEMAQRIADAADPAPLLAYVQELERIATVRTRTKARAAGVITLAVGFAMTLLLSKAAPGTAAYLVGLIPLLVGVALLIVSELFLRPRTPAA